MTNLSSRIQPTVQPQWLHCGLRPIQKKGNLKNIGLPEGAPLDQIIIKEKENQKLEVIQKKPKKKKFC